MDTTTITTLAAVAGSLSGTLATGALAWFFFVRYIKQNDKKHEKTNKTIDNNQEKTRKAIEKIADSLTDIVKDLAGIKIALGHVIELKPQIQKDHDEVIRMGEWKEKYCKDLLNQFEAIRCIENRFEDLNKVISSFSREAASDGK